MRIPTTPTSGWQSSTSTWHRTPNDFSPYWQPVSGRLVTGFLDDRLQSELDQRGDPVGCRSQLRADRIAQFRQLAIGRTHPTSFLYAGCHATADLPPDR